MLLFCLVSKQGSFRDLSQHELDKSEDRDPALVDYVGQISASHNLLQVTAMGAVFKGSREAGRGRAVSRRISVNVTGFT